MKKKIVRMGIIFILLVVGLNGCLEQDGNGETSGDTDKVELVSYVVTTTWREYVDLGEYGVRIPETIDVEKSGFYHNIPKKISGLEIGRYTEARYYIRVNVRNIAGEIIDVEIKAKFYDKNDNHLTTKTKSIKNIANSYIAYNDFSYSESEKYFESVDSVKFDFKVL